MIRTVRARWVMLACALALCQPIAADHIQPGFNLFSLEQDIEIGRQSEAEADRQLPLLRDSNVERYVNDIVGNLARSAPGGRYPYHIKVINQNEINAMSLPGGPMYVNRGLITAARNEAELAGVLAHEMAHVALRHGTHQASKAYLGQAGIGLLGGLIGRGGNNTGQIIEAIGGLGLNAVFLKHSRNDEYQADSVGAEIMAKSGYNPIAMATFFETLRAQQKREPGKLEQFFSSHPPASDREARIRKQAAGMQVAGSRETGNFQRIQASLGGLPASGQQRAAIRQAPRGGYGSTTARGQVRIEPPSSRYARFDQREGFFSIEYPDNWQAYTPSRGMGVTFVPPGGMIDGGNGQEVILNGVIINHYDPFESGGRGNVSLTQATDDVARQITTANSYLRAGVKRRETIDQRPGFSVNFSGTSPVTGQDERVTLITRQLSDGHVLYAVLITPGSAANTMGPVFQRMVRSLNVDDQAAHRTPTTN
jgi:Zn-dependent protease with chaperone function